LPRDRIPPGPAREKGISRDEFVMDDKARERYSRQLSIDGFGEEAQEKLAGARVFVAGAGGLGCSASLYLAAAGIGKMRILDHGKIELGNLNRQILYTDRDVGMRKARTAADKIEAFNEGVRVEPLDATLAEGNARSLISDCDVIVDALDTIPARYALNKAAIGSGIPIVHGAVFQFYGQLMTIIPGETPCLMCLYRGKASPESVPVIGAAPGVIGLLQAMETIKYLTGLGRQMKGSLLVFDGLQMTFTEIDIPRDPDCPHCGRLPSGS
jgi:molybdopterin/thiamine biosynthesis adenylyltransferase